MSKLRIAGAALVAATVMGATAANAAEAGWYASIGGGVNWVDVNDENNVEWDMEGGYTVQGAVGYDFGDNGSSVGKFRVEAEIAYTQNDNESVKAGGTTFNIGGDLEQTSFMVNGLFDFMPNSGFRPYIGAGLGIVDAEQTVSLAGISASANGTEFAYRGLAGVGISLGENVTLDVGYRYTRVTSDTEYANNAAIAQVRFGF